jgi:hypothetical protein
MTGDLELYAQEEAEIFALDDWLAVAQRATRDATAARARAVSAGSGLPFTVSGISATVAPAEDAALAAAVDAEQALLVERTRLHERINAARAARKDPRT